MIFNKYTYLLAGLLMIILSGCYSFTGSSLDPRIKSINIATFPNYAPLQNPNLSQRFSNDLTLRFTQRTSLSPTNTEEDADILLSGEITGYEVTPTTVVSGDVAAQNKLSIRVNVNYQNNIQPEKSFTKTFTAYENFEASLTLAQVEDALIQNINERLIDQIFNAIVADW